jgi:hypothetical protein
MNPKVYNACTLASLLMIGGGTAVYSIPAAIIVTGFLLLMTTIVTLALAR